MVKNRVFLACNYSNQKVKNHFNNLKERLEEELPIHVVLIDKETGNASKDFWRQICAEIAECSLCIFDVSAFRPNVVLELGYAIAIKDEKQILITYDERKTKNGKHPDWLLSDISHLHRVKYKQIKQMDAKIMENISIVPAVSAFTALCGDAKSTTSIPDKYKDAALKILHILRNTEVLTDQQLDNAIKGTNVQRTTLTALLKKHKLARRDRGRGGWRLNCG
jgi:nucleoside 2-deoxyribosyltransferase